MKKRLLTTNQGVPVSDNQNTLTVGERGPVLLQDVQFVEKMAHFDRERIPERVVHAKGAGAHGYFQVYKSMKPYTKAKFLQDPKKKTPVFVRFSTVTGGRGSADTVRDPRGFAVKFYTEDGNYDLVGNNLPVFFIRDAIKFPDMVHAFKGAPDTNIPSASSAHNRFWDFISLTPESTHMITWLFSDRGTPKSYRMQEGFGVNTYVWVNAEGKAVYVKYHWKPKLGQLPVNRPIVPVDNNQRDGAMQIGQFSGPVNYEPNSLGGGMPGEAAEEGTPRVYRIEGEATRQKISKTNDFEQARERYLSLSKMDQKHLVDNLIADLMHIDKPIQQRVIENLTKASQELGRAVAKGLKL